MWPKTQLVGNSAFGSMTGRNSAPPPQTLAPAHAGPLAVLPVRWHLAVLLLCAPYSPSHAAIAFRLACCSVHESLAPSSAQPLLLLNGASKNDLAFKESAHGIEFCVDRVERAVPGILSLMPIALNGTGRRMFERM